MAKTFNLGQKVRVKGTGERWKGMEFNAVVVDLRKSDGTVKVRYANGGYKRFKVDELKALEVAGAGQDSGEFEAYEIFEDFYDSHVDSADNLSDLREQINAAVRKQDFKEAQRFRDQMDEVVKTTESMRSLKAALMRAVQQEEFLEADRIKMELEKFQAGLSKEAGQAAGGAELNTSEVLNKALKRALGGGLAGATAMVMQVSCLMWMRTTMNYQYRYGTTTMEAFRALYADGGIPRFYRGIGPAFLQGPLSRFGDTAANTGVLAYLNATPSTQGLPTAVKTVAASACAATWRIFLMPLDTVKTTMQVEGAQGLSKVMAKAKVGGPTVFYHGAMAASAATFAGHYPWFLTYNTLSANIPVPESKIQQLGRNAVLGFCSSFVSDTTSNSLRVIKTYRQTNENPVTYPQAVRDIVKADGVVGLFGRGLQTRILANGVQGILFSVLWKYFEKKFAF